MYKCISTLSIRMSKST